jgi:signal transduction histidine kinase
MSRSGGGLRQEFLDDGGTEVLASSSKFQNGVELIRVAIHLTGPEVLYNTQRTRSFYFGLVLAFATGTAITGVLLVRKTLSRQLELTRLQSNFVSSVSHELRAPIASMRLMAENLSSGKVTEEGRRKEYFHIIRQECRRLSALVENVLDFARIDQGRKQYEFEPTDVNALVRTTVELMRSHAEQRGVVLQVENAVEPSSAPNLDGKALQQALVNLLDNAIKHSPEGGKITVGVEVAPDTVRPGTTRPEPTRCLLLWVEDEGPGIPAEEHERIFERFYRLGSELRRETTGVGIGLSIVKHIAESHSGCVRVRSAPGEGSRFTLVLPCIDAVPDPRNA